MLLEVYSIGVKCRCFLPHLSERIKMLNYRNYLFKNIGKRIKTARTALKRETQVEFSNSLQDYYIHMDRYRLSSIEMGKADKNNPHLIARDSIKGIADYIGISTKELIFGNSEDRDSFVKHVLLAIIINGEKHYKTKEIINPIIDTERININIEEFFRIAMLNIQDVEIQKEVTKAYTNNKQKYPKALISKCIKWYEENYEFFADSSQYQNISYLINEFNKDLEIQSNLLINTLFSDQDFAFEFMSGGFNLARLTSNVEENFSKLIESKGQFGGLALDWKEFGYSKFVTAFNAMWARNKDCFVNYFEKNIFNVDIEEQGLRGQNNDFFHSLITDSSFQNIIYKILNKERYTIKTMMGHRVVQNFIESYLVESNDGLDDLSYESGYNLYKFNYDIHQLTQSYNQLKDMPNKNHGNLLLHINDYFNITSFNKN